ncbi:SpoIIE family protein phosphatase [Kitasatospora sp. NBC_01266]|uniref:SpoIIE family protein phosphatase n=1 Tax=Kitasatospora sp. NBC_01266 TaxID=2903572 RepID=UPI002E33F609|nr:SpoIIE family protein phosphatase [Kitasatospora sp. NBC_01266]
MREPRPARDAEGRPGPGAVRLSPDLDLDLDPDPHPAAPVAPRPVIAQRAPCERPPAASDPGGAVSRLAATVERLRHQLERARAAADGQALVELAKGILVERLACGPAQAARQLESLADQAGLPVLELAAELVNQAARDRITDIAREFTATGAETSLAVRLRSAETGMLAAADVQAVARSALENALRPLGAVAVAIWAADADQSLTLAGSAGFSEREVSGWRRVPPGVPTPARKALDDRAATRCDSPTGAALPSIGLREVSGGRLAVPARTGGRIIGVLEVCWPAALPEQSQSLQRQFEALAELCATALESRPAARSDRAADPGLAELRELADGLNDPCLILEPVFEPTDRVSGFLIRHVNPSFAEFAGHGRGRERGHGRVAVAGARLLEACPLAAEPGGLLEKAEHVLATGESVRAARMTSAALFGGVSPCAGARVSLSRHGGRVVVVWRPDEGTPSVASLLQHAQRLGRIGGFEENLRTREIAWNDTLFDLYGLPPAAEPIPIDQLPDHAHPDDAHTIGRFLRALLHHQRPASTAFRLRRADGSARHIRVVAEPVLGEDARISAVRGAYQDVSAQHWTEVALAATRDQLAHTEQQAAERSRLALQLQHAIMPPSRGPLDLHGLRVAVRYRPAEKDHLVGGDWYDCVALPTGHVLLCVGDVAGHGIEAATGMVALRNALRGLAATGAGPAQLLCWLNTVTHHLTDGVTATAVCALYEPRTRLLRWARAGHLPPLLLRDGRASELPKLSGVLLGALDRTEYAQGELRLKSRDTLLLYTDGLIERRDRSLQDSLDSLLATAQDPGLADDPAGLEHRLDHLLRYSSSDTDDDTCLIGVRVS